MSGEPARETPGTGVSETLSPCRAATQNQRSGRQNWFPDLPHCTARIPLFSSEQTPNFAKQSLPRRANSISTLLVSDFAADSTSTSILSSHACVFAKRLKRVPKRIIATKSSPGCRTVRRSAPANHAGAPGFGHRIHRVAFGSCVDRVFVASVERGVQQACSEGILAGYRVVDVNVNFYDGKMHPVDSNDISFQVAGYWAFKEAFLKARPCLLEPIHSLEIRVPEDCVGKIIGDLSSRRGKVVGMDAGSRLQVVHALALT